MESELSPLMSETQRQRPIAHKRNRAQSDEDEVSSMSESSASDHSDLMEGCTPVTTESYDILERQLHWIETELSVIDKMSIMFVNRMLKLLVHYKTLLLELDESLTAALENAILQYNETVAMSHLAALYRHQIAKCGESHAQREEFFTMTSVMLNALSQIKTDGANLRNLLLQNREMNFLPYSVQEMHDYYNRRQKKRRRIERQARGLSTGKKSKKKNDAIPEFVEVINQHSYSNDPMWPEVDSTSATDQASTDISLL